MKVVILSDIHIGARSGNTAVAAYQLRILDNMIDYMKEHKIRTILQLGDVFDNRVQTKHTILDLWEERFFKRLKEENFVMHILVGNHDSSLKNHIKVNSPKLFLSKYDNLIIYDEPQDIEVYGMKFLVLPWICQDNFPQSLDAIAKSKAHFVLGHLELAEFEMHRGQMATEGMDHKVFQNFEKVFTGHYHTRSKKDNIEYLGCPFELTWADYNDPRGFHVFDCKGHKLKFIENSEVMFNRIEYDDTGKGDDYWKSFDIKALAGKILKLYVVNKTEIYQFDMLLDALYAGGLEDFKILEEFQDMSADAVDDEEIDLEDSMTLVDSYVNAIEFDGDKVKLKTLMKSLYVAALAEGM